MLKIDLHVHSLASGHAFNTIFELISYAGKKRIELLGITDHGPSMQGASHLGYFEMIEQIPEELDGVKIIAGCEANIISLEGKIDLPINIQRKIALIIAGLHRRTPFPERTTTAENTRAIVKAIQRNEVDILAHPYRPEFPVNIREVFRAAVDYGVLLELNLSLLNRYSTSNELLEQIYLMLELVEAKNEKITISSDAHIATQLGDDSILTRLRFKIPATLLLGNRRGYQEIKEFLNSRRK